MRRCVRLTLSSKFDAQGVKFAVKVSAFHTCCFSKLANAPFMLVKVVIKVGFFELCTSIFKG